MEVSVIILDWRETSWRLVSLYWTEGGFMEVSVII